MTELTRHVFPNNGHDAPAYRLTFQWFPDPVVHVHVREDTAGSTGAGAETVGICSDTLHCTRFRAQPSLQYSLQLVYIAMEDDYARQTLTGGHSAFIRVSESQYVLFQGSGVYEVHVNDVIQTFSAESPSKCIIVCAPGRRYTLLPESGIVQVGPDDDAQSDDDDDDLANAPDMMPVLTRVDL